MLSPGENREGWLVIGEDEVNAEGGEELEALGGFDI